MLEPGDPQVPHPSWGKEVTVRMQGVLEDRTVVEKDCNLVFVIGERDVIQVTLFNIMFSIIECLLLVYVSSHTVINRSRSIKLQAYVGGFMGVKC